MNFFEIRDWSITGDPQKIWARNFAEKSIRKLLGVTKYEGFSKLQNIGMKNYTVKELVKFELSNVFVNF